MSASTVFRVTACRATMPAHCWGRYWYLDITLARYARDTNKEIEVEVIKYWPKCHEGTTARAAASIARNSATTLCVALNRVYARSDSPSMAKLTAFSLVHTPDNLPRVDSERYYGARALRGTIADVIGYYGYTNIAEMINAAEPAALNFRARLGERHLVLLDRAIDVVDAGMVS